MKLVDKQVLRETVGPFLFGAAAFSSVFFAGTYMLRLTQWIMGGMPLLTAAQIVVLYLSGIVVYTLPMATLLAVLVGVGRLSSDSEVTALFAGGVSIYRLAAPIIALGIVVSALAIALNEVVAPGAMLRNQELQAAVLKQESTSDRSFTLRDDETDSLVTVGGMDGKTGALENVTITHFVERQPAVIVFAKRAEWKGLHDHEARYEWKLYDGFQVQLEADFPPKSTFRQFSTSDIRKTPRELSLFQKKPDEMSFADLSRMVKYLKAHPDRPVDQIRQMDVDRWNKLALPLSSLVFAMLAAPMAIRPQRTSSSVGLGMSILVIFLYWMVWHYTSALAIQGSLDAPVGAFAADVLGIAAAAALLKRSAK